MPWSSTAAPANAGALERERWARRVRTWAGLLVVVALWMIARPYRGVRHDGILYLGQTLGRLMPDTIGHDLFLAYGSQDRYSIFSPLMAPLVQHLGVGISQMAVLAVAELAFIVACWKLTSTLPSRFLRWCAMLSLVSLPHIYGNWGLLAFAEPFLTARSLCEPFVLLALGLLLEGRAGRAALAMAVATLFHPLIALPAIVASWIYLVLQDRRWLWALALVLVPAAAGALGLAPFDAMWRRYDQAWWDAVQQATRQVFFSAATMLDWAPTMFDVGVLLLAVRLLRPSPMARLVQAMLICTVVFIALWGVGCDLVRDVLITQLQLWRVLWLTHLLAVMLLPVLLVSAWDRGSVGRWSASAVVLAAIALGANLGTGWICVLWAGLALLALHGGAKLSPGVTRLAMAVSLLCALLVTWLVGRQTLHVVEAVPSRFNGIGSIQVVLGLTACSALLGFVALRGLGATGWRRALAMGVAVVLAVGGASSWDQRSAWQRYMENGLQATGLPFEGRIPVNAKVYWSDSLLESWMLGHRPNFLATEQSAGLLFNRETAVVYTAHVRIVAPLLAKREFCTTVGLYSGADLDNPDTCAPSVDDVKSLCATPGGPDIAIFRAGDVSKAMGADATWADPTLHRAYRLYDCRRAK